MVALIPLLPFIGFLLNAFFGRRLSKGTSGAVASAVMAASFAASAVVVWQLLGYAPDSREISSHLFNWFTSGDLSIDFTLRVDPLSAVMILIITGIGTLIHVYSTSYMHDETDAEFARYFSYLNLFAAFMLVLVLGANFLVLFLGWEGVGLCSYLLVGFWYQKKSASDAGKKAFIVNRVGDFGFILGVFLIFTKFGTLDFQHIARAASGLGPETAFGTISTMTLLLFVGATGKSAQIPLFVWLPDAMEGPTPVSALIHAATMVTAGVYMIGRNAVLFSLAPQTLTIVAVIGTATALMAGTIAIVQNDIKKVLAYSTVSQLGYMFLAMGVGAYASGIFHLYTHAFFKALLFLGSGAVIHALHGEQDMRRMGGLKKELPITYWTFLIGAIAIAGVPGFAGFFSKDEILFNTFASGHTLLWAVGLLTSLLTAIYMFRVVFLTFHGERHAAVEHEGHEAHADAGHLHDAPPAMAFALIVLAVGSVVAGYAGLDGRFAHFLEPSFGGALVDRGGDGSMESTLMVVSSLVAITGIGLAFFFFVKSRQAAASLASTFSGIHRVLERKYYVDEIYDAGIVQPIRIIAEEGLWKGLDVRVIDGAVNGAGVIVRGTSNSLRKLQTGSVRAYAASLFFGVVAVLGVLPVAMTAFPILSSLVALPIAGALLLLFVPGGDRQDGLAKRVALVISLLVFVETLLLWWHFNPGTSDFQFLERHDWIPAFGISYSVGVDGISLLLVVLTGFLTPIALLSSWESVHKNTRAFCICLLLLESAMIGVFVSMDLFLFYVFWDAMLIPMYFLIGIWGYDRRVYAAIKFLIYTMAGSVLMLLAIIGLAVLNHADTGRYTFDLLTLYDLQVPANLQFWFFLAFALAFAIKVPLFPFHTWLPDAHVEAPTAGSVILAGVLLKMGTYGLIRFAFPLFPLAATFFAPYLAFLAVVGIIYGALVAMVQPDLKKLVAYSSVSHLGFVVLGITALNVNGLQGAVYQMLSHGVSTGGLFLLVGMLSDRRHTRLISEFGGLKKVMPRFVAVFLIVTLSSIGLPGLNGFIGEFLILLGAFRADPRMAVAAASGVILSAVYMLWMFQRVNYGPVTNEKNAALPDLKPREWAAIVPIVAVALLMGILPNLFLRPIEPSVERMLNHVRAAAPAEIRASR